MDIFIDYTFESFFFNSIGKIRYLVCVGIVVMWFCDLFGYKKKKLKCFSFDLLVRMEFHSKASNKEKKNIANYIKIKWKIFQLRVKKKPQLKWNNYY